MYGNDILPGVNVSDTYRDKGSIWRGYTEATWFKVVQVNGSTEEAVSIREGTIMKELAADGSYTPITASDIVSSNANLPGSRLAIVADKNAKTGTTKTTTEGTEATSSSVLVGIQGHVDKARIFVGDTPFTELSNSQQISLNSQLEAWNFLLVNVQQS